MVDTVCHSVRAFGHSGMCMAYLRCLFVFFCIMILCAIRQHFQARHLFNHPKNDAGSPLTRVRGRKIEKSNVKTTNFVKYDNTENIVTLSRHIVSRPKVVNSQVIYWICFRVYFFRMDIVHYTHWFSQSLLNCRCKKKIHIFSSNIHIYFQWFECRTKRKNIVNSASGSDVR